MRDILPTLQSWIADGKRFATATVTQTWGSSPRPIGSVMAIREDGTMCGSVSGGCVETAVIDASIEAIKDGKSRELRFEAVTEDSVWDVGLSCGGRIQIQIAPNPASRNLEQWNTLTQRLEKDLPSVLITREASEASELWVPGEPDPLGGLVTRAYESRTSCEIDLDGSRVFLNVFASRDRLIIVGSVHIAVPLVRFAKDLGFETVVVDPRQAFASAERYPTPPDRLVIAWPEEAFSAIGLNENTYVAILTHDPKIDDVALSLVLSTEVAYVGALGSRVTQGKRHEFLREKGFSDQEIARIHGPIGLSIGARTPEEIALSIAAELVQVKRSRSKKSAT